MKPRVFQAGFTMVELMVVVALVGVLATVALPNYVKSRASAQTSACLSNLQQIDSAVQSWAADLKRGPEQPVAYEDIRNYLKHSVSCPAGGTTFEDSYTLTTVSAPPTCRRQPATHQLPQ